MDATLIQADLAFEPDGARATRLDREIRGDLAASLEHLASCCQGRIPFDVDGLQRLIRGLKAGDHYAPASFAIYSYLVFSLLQNDHSRAAILFSQLTQLEPQSPQSEIICFDDPRISPYRQQMQSLMEFDAEDSTAMVSVDPQVLASFLQDYDWAMERLEDVLPELAAEIHAMVRQLILISIPDSGNRLIFDGGSSPMLWGGMFINAARKRSPLELLEVLVHESAHLLLYAFTQHEPLVLNDEAERYTSPLRTDPRPMEGIFHATWVSARMAYAMYELSRSPQLDTALRSQALVATQVDLANFNAGHSLIKAHAILTETGRGVIDAANAAMCNLGLSVQAKP